MKSIVITYLTYYKILVIGLEFVFVVGN